MHHLHQWQSNHPQLSLQATHWSSHNASAQSHLVRALARDILACASPVHEITRHFFDLLVDQPHDRQHLVCTFSFWDEELDQGQHIGLDVRLTRMEDWNSIHAPWSHPQAASPHPAQALWVDAQAWLEAPTASSILQAAQTLSGRFPTLPFLTQARALASGLAIWAMARQFQARECEISRQGLFDHGQPHTLDVIVQEKPMVIFKDSEGQLLH